MFKNKIAVVTGGAQGIGKTIAREFQKEGASVCIIDRQPNPYFVGDLAEEEPLCRFAEKVMKDFGRVDYLIHNALPLMKGIDECSYEEFNYALRVTAPLLSDKTVPALLFSSRGHCQYLFLPGSYEPAADRKLYDRQRRDFCSYPRPGRQPDRKGSG